MVQWLRFCAPNAGDPSLIPGQGTRSHMLEIRVCMLQLKKKKIPYTTKKIKDLRYLKLNIKKEEEEEKAFGKWLAHG